jgi:four helix bundle protein
VLTCPHKRGNSTDDEKYGLVSQMRRAAVSIASNIAEGSARNSKKEFIQYLYIAAGSASELETQLEISREVDITETRILSQVTGSLEEVIRMLHGLIRFLKKKK